MCAHVRTAGTVGMHARVRVSVSVNRYVYMYECMRKCENVCMSVDKPECEAHCTCDEWSL